MPLAFPKIRCTCRLCMETTIFYGLASNVKGCAAEIHTISTNKTHISIYQFDMGAANSNLVEIIIGKCSEGEIKTNFPNIWISPLTKRRCLIAHIFVLYSPLWECVRIILSWHVSFLFLHLQTICCRHYNLACIQGKLFIHSSDLGRVA